MTIEDWAQKIVTKELNTQVEVYDNGSESGMYDLIAGPVNAPEYAIECVGSVDPAATETWNIGPAKGPMKVCSSGNWLVSIKKSTRIKSLKIHISKAIFKCESLGLTEFTPVDWQLRRFNLELFNELDELGITSFQMYKKDGSGYAHLSMDGGGGPINQSSDALIDWIGSFLSSHDKLDVVNKLRKSRAKEKHAFVPIVLGGAPWEVESYFLGKMHLPCKEPNLPEPITGVWVLLNGKGLRHINGQWHVFSY
ncbi:hypothetical protein VT06_16530 [Arsukibacterium sp. MJ3]|uniref:hypothetical protein n=1 Tax=Arsukibacterium sp. MJ3 TaxID=1632859 RepID=UPI0006271864|nr:hypothetical protein [Arsukibacterium sp. MJ3]KKO47540.1 hypothetical protein VT06_16530 [Arsukibacterium sp. MJ3]